MLIAESENKGTKPLKGQSVRTVTKADLIEAIYEKTGKGRSEVKDYVEELIDLIKRAMTAKDGVLISGFGKFEVHDKRSRLGRNPHTRQPMMLPARRVATFRLSNKFRNELNAWQVRAQVRRPAFFRTFPPSSLRGRAAFFVPPACLVLGKSLNCYGSRPMSRPV